MNCKQLNQKIETKHSEIDHQMQYLEIKKLVEEKKEAFAAQFAAEAALRRLHESQNDDDPLPVEAIIAPLEADIKIYRAEVSQTLFFHITHYKFFRITHYNY